MRSYSEFLVERLVSRVAPAAEHELIASRGAFTTRSEPTMLLPAPSNVLNDHLLAEDLGEPLPMIRHSHRCRHRRRTRTTVLSGWVGRLCAAGRTASQRRDEVMMASRFICLGRRDSKAANDQDLSEPRSAPTTRTC